MRKNLVQKCVRKTPRKRFCHTSGQTGLITKMHVLFTWIKNITWSGTSFGGDVSVKEFGGYVSRGKVAGRLMWCTRWGTDLVLEPCTSKYTHGPVCVQDLDNYTTVFWPFLRFLFVCFVFFFTRKWTCQKVWKEIMFLLVCFVLFMVVFF